MPSTTRVANPFALMIDPQAVVAQMERSERLEMLQRRVCRPLDRPLLPGKGDAEGGEQAAFDQEVDGQGDASESANGHA